MGSDPTYTTVAETAQILGVGTSQVHLLSKRGYLDAYRPESGTAGKMFRRDDVIALRDLRLQTNKMPMAQLQQVAAKALLASKRAERRIEELANYLGLDAPTLSLNNENVISFYRSAQAFIDRPVLHGPEDALDWAKKLLGITEEYLDLTGSLVGNPAAWQVFMQVGRRLAERCSPRTSARAYVDHARRNLRNASYFYVRGKEGARVANRMFPLEGYTTDLIRTMFPSA